MRKRFLSKGSNRILPKESDKPSIAVVIRPLTQGDIVGQSLLANFLQILRPLSAELSVITGNYPLNPEDKVHLIKVEGGEKLSDSTLTRIVKYILVELRVTYNLVRVGKNVDIVVLFIGASGYVMPVLAAKLMRKKVALVMAGSSRKVMALVHQRKLFGLGGTIFPRILAFLERLNFALSDRIATESERLVEQMDLTKYASKVLPYSALFVDTDLFNRGRKPGERRSVVGYVGRLTEEKGAMNFIHAMPVILEQQKDVEFFIGGDGWLLPDIKAALRDNNLYTKVRITGRWIPHEELPAYLKELKLLVLPSYTEGLPNVVLEAMACGTPVLAASVGAVADLIQDGETGFILEDNSPECIARGVIRALNHPDLDAVVRNAHVIIEKKYTYEVAVERYGNILHQLLGIEHG